MRRRKRRCYHLQGPCALFVVCVIGLTVLLDVVGALIAEGELLTACDYDYVSLVCAADRDNIIVLYEAEFTTDPEKAVSSTTAEAKRCFSGKRSLQKADSCTDDLRLVVNARCSGHKRCHFNVSTIGPRQCYGPGVLSLRYGCAPASHVFRYCNFNVSGDAAEGFVHNPGYPNYYPGPITCTWSIRGRPGQTVLVEVLDLSLQPLPVSVQSGRTVFRPTWRKPTAEPEIITREAQCRDYVQLYDGDVKMLHACGSNSRYLLSHQTEASSASVVFVSRDVWPSRGLLIYYRVLGCPNLAPPDHGYLVYRNISTAHYMCCLKHVFEDTYRRHRILSCLDGNHWNGSVVPCRSVRAIQRWANTTGMYIEDDFADGLPVRRVALESGVLIWDILVPSLIMGTMVISNVVIVLVILRVRRRVKNDSEFEIYDVASELQGITPIPKPNGATGTQGVTKV